MRPVWIDLDALRRHPPRQGEPLGDEAALIAWLHGDGGHE
jgi:hypothetical protein